MLVVLGTQVLKCRCWDIDGLTDVKHVEDPRSGFFQLVNLRLDFGLVLRSSGPVCWFGTGPWHCYVSLCKQCYLLLKCPLYCVYVTVQGFKPTYLIWQLIGQVVISLQRHCRGWKNRALVLYLPLQSPCVLSDSRAPRYCILSQSLAIACRAGLSWACNKIAKHLKIFGVQWPQAQGEVQKPWKRHISEQCQKFVSTTSS